MRNNVFEHQAMKCNDFLRAGKQIRWANTYTNLLPGENAKITDRDGGPKCSLEESLNWGDVAGKSEKAMAPDSSTLALKIPWTGEPGRLQSMESLRVGHDWTTSLSLFTFMHWRRKWQPTPVFLPRESQGWGSPMGCVHGVAQSRTLLKRFSSSSSSSSWEVRQVRAARVHRQSNRKERAALRECVRNVQRVPLRSSAVYWSGPLCGEVTMSRQ